MNKEINDKMWKKLDEFSRVITAKIIMDGVVPNDWNLTFEEVREYVDDAFVYLIKQFKPRKGGLSLSTYCFKYGERIAVKSLLDVYKRLKSEKDIDDFIRQYDEGHQPRQYGRQEEIERKSFEEHLEDQIDVNYLKEIADVKDRQIMDGILRSLSYDELAKVLGISKGTITKRLRKYRSVLES